MLHKLFEKCNMNSAVNVSTCQSDADTVVSEVSKSTGN